MFETAVSSQLASFSPELRKWPSSQPVSKDKKLVKKILLSPGEWSPPKFSIFGRSGRAERLEEHSHHCAGPHLSGESSVAPLPTSFVLRTFILMTELFVFLLAASPSVSQFLSPHSGFLELLFHRFLSRPRGAWASQPVSNII